MLAPSLVALAACVDVHPFPARTVNATRSTGGGASVNAPGFYSMTFSDSAFHFPTSFMIGTTEMLGASATADTTDEIDVGISYYPIQRFDGKYAATSPTATDLTVPLGGPSVAKVALDWGAMTCMNMAVPAGSTTFTFFPDGRITRYDHVTLPGTVTASACDPMAPGWFITSFTTFNTQAIQNVYPTGIPNPTPGDPGISADNFQYLSGAHAIGYGWTDNSTRVRAPDTTTVALVHDFVPPKMATVMDVKADVTTTMLLDDHGTFDSLGARMNPYIMSPDVQLLVNGNPVGLALDGIYGGTQLDMPAGMKLADSHVTLQADGTTVPGGFAVWIDYGTSVTTFAVNREHSVDIIGGTQAIFWFPSDLAPGDTITITPQ